MSSLYRVEDKAKSPAPAVNHWPELDGLRGAAILMVLGLHYIANSRTSDHGFGLLYSAAQLFRLGWTGVDLFFVLSGFLIGGILLDASSSPNYAKTFYIRRVYRIIPIYYVWLTLYGLIGGLLIWTGGLRPTNWESIR